MRWASCCILLRASSIVSFIVAATSDLSKKVVSWSRVSTKREMDRCGDEAMLADGEDNDLQRRPSAGAVALSRDRGRVRVCNRI